MSDVSISLIIKNNPRLTERWLRYMSFHESDAEIYIADASDCSQKNLVDKFAGRLKIVYEYFTKDHHDYGYVNRKIRAINRCSTKYHIFADNDDFYSLKGIMRSIAVLDADYSIVACGGRVVFFERFESNLLKSFYLSAIKEIGSFDRARHSDRISRFFKFANSNYSYAQNYSVTRTSVLKEIAYRFRDELSVDPLAFEMSYNFLLLYFGKSFFHDGVYYYRDRGTSSLTSLLNSEKGNYDRLLDDGWIARIDLFIDTNFSIREQMHIKESVAIWLDSQKSKAPIRLIKFIKQYSFAMDLKRIILAFVALMRRRYKKVFLNPEEIKHFLF